MRLLLNKCPKTASIVMFFVRLHFHYATNIIDDILPKTETLDISVFKIGILFLTLTILMFTKLVLYL